MHRSKARHREDGAAAVEFYDAAHHVGLVGLPHHNPTNPGGCATTENTDGDNHVCESLSSDLELVFRQVAEQALGPAPGSSRTSDV